MSETYNGWTNYETWLVNVWLTNDEGTNDDTMKIARAYIDDDGQPDIRGLATDLREYVEQLPDVERATASASIASDLVDAALQTVDWREIAEHYYADACEGY